MVFLINENEPEYDWFDEESERVAHSQSFAKIKRQNELQWGHRHGEKAEFLFGNTGVDQF
jgi:hypothetical protein